jgi:hypothetical protein
MSSATAGEPHTNSNMGLTMLVIYGGRENPAPTMMRRMVS